MASQRGSTDPLHPTDVDIFTASSAIVSGNGGNSLTITGTDGNDTLTIMRSAVNADYLLVELQSGTGPSQIQFCGLMESVSSIAVQGLGGTNALTIDFSNGSPVPAGGFAFNGGAGADSLIVIGAPGPDSVTLNGSVLTFGTSTITYNFVENLTIDVGVGNDVLTQIAPAGAGVALNASAGTVTINSTINLAALNIADSARGILAAGDGRVITTNALTLTGTGTLDLFDNDLIVQSDAANRAAVLAAVTGHIAAARNTSPNLWQGHGLTTSSADPVRQNNLTGLAVVLNEKLDPAGQPQTIFASFDGQGVDRNSILVKYSWNGDARPDGLINFDDYYQLNTGFLGQSSQPPLTGYRWGDFNLDGVINFDDYFLLNQSFLGQGNTILGPSQVDEESDIPGDALSISPVLSTFDSYQPGLTIDLFDASTGLKEVPVLYVGQTVTLAVWATVTGSNPDAYPGLQSLVGSFVATQVNGGAVTGRIARYQIDSTFKSNGWSYGTQQDLNGDGNLDLGSNNPDSASGWWIANASSMDWAPDPGTYTWYLGTIKFTITDVFAPGGTTEINFRGRDGWDNGALWEMDDTLQNGSSPDIHIGAPVVVTR